jgi:hypothetical protein
MLPPLLSPTASRAVGEDGAGLSRRRGGGWLPWRPSEVVALVSVAAERAARGGRRLVARAMVTVVSATVGRVAHDGGQSLIVLLTPSFIPVVGGRAHPTLGWWPSLVEPVSHHSCRWWLLRQGRLT